MQVDMHYYATYAIAKAAGFPDEHAEIIAYASQYVDDATSNENAEHGDRGRLTTFSTAHHLPQSAATMAETLVRQEPEDQRKIWVVNHFIPGGVGESFEEKALCVEDSEVARTMFKEHVEFAKTRYSSFGLHLLGIASHAYMDTFSHYDFSGFSSKYNRIRAGSIKYNAIRNESAEKEIEDRVKRGNLGKLAKEYLTNMLSFFAEGGDAALGHGVVLSLPDTPYLNWEFSFEIDRSVNGFLSKRNNPQSFLRACEGLYAMLSSFVRACYSTPTICDFSQIKGSIVHILATEGNEIARSEAWKKSGLIPDDAFYDHQRWEEDRRRFSKYATSAQGLSSHSYKFHQAATYHRYYVLKDLLPRFGIAAY